MMFGPLRQISPVPVSSGFSILISTPGKAFPALPGFGMSGEVRVETAAVSVSPYPSAILNPRDRKPLYILGSSFAPPEVKNLNCLPKGS